MNYRFFKKRIAATSIFTAIYLICYLNTGFAQELSATDRLASYANISQEEAHDRLNLVFSFIAQELQAKREVAIRGFGKFKLQHRTARKGRNPKTGNPIEIPAKDYPKFQSSDLLKEKVNQ